MFSRKKYFLAVTLTLLFGCWPAAGAPREVSACPNGCCASPLGVPCAPRRITYGYHPTTWRRWPENSVAKKPETDELPTPAKSPEPKVEADVMPSPSDETLPAPDDTLPAFPDTAKESPAPLDDNPPMPPRDDDLMSPPSSEPSDGPSRLPRPIDFPPSGEEGLKPADSNPFQDDPEPAPPADTSGSRIRRGRETAGQVSHGHIPKPSSSLVGNSGVRLVPATDEPRALQPLDTDGRVPRTSGGAEAGTRPRNPLRSPSQQAGGQQVVRAADWSAEASASGESGGSWRRNPLRGQ